MSTIYENISYNKSMNIGNRIKELRILNNLTQSQLAQLVFVSQDTVSLWERGKSLPSLHDLIRLVKVFKVTSDFLLGLED